MGSLSVELKLGVAIAAVCLAAAAAGAWISGGIFERQIEDAGMATLQSASESFAAQERVEVEKLGATLDALLANADLREAFAARDRDRLQARAAPLFAKLQEHGRISHWYFIEPDPTRAVFLRVHRPDVFGDRVERVTLQRAIDTGDLGAGKELGKTAFALRVVRPWMHQGRLLGYVELAEDLGQLLAGMKSRTGDEYGILVKKRFLDEAAFARVFGGRASTWNDRPDVVVAGATTLAAGILDFGGDVERVPERGLALGEALRGERAYVRGVFPLRDAAGRKVGGLVVLHDFSRQHGAVRAAVVQAAAALMGLGLATAVVLLLLAHWLLFAPLERLRHSLEDRASQGGLAPLRGVGLHGLDDLGRMEALFGSVLGEAPPRVPTPKVATPQPPPPPPAKPAGRFDA